MNTNGHYDVRRRRSDDYISDLKCLHCSFAVGVRALRRTGDKSGAGAYCRALGIMRKHLHAEHRPALALPAPGEPIYTAA